MVVISHLPSCVGSSPQSRRPGVWSEGLFFPNKPKCRWYNSSQRQVPLRPSPQLVAGQCRSLPFQGLLRSLHPRRGYIKGCCLRRCFLNVCIAIRILPSLLCSTKAFGSKMQLFFIKMLSLCNPAQALSSSPNGDMEQGNSSLLKPCSYVSDHCGTSS